MSLAELELSVRATNCLECEGITTVRDLVSRSEDELLKVRNFGETTLKEVKAKLHEIGLDLGVERPRAPGGLRPSAEAGDAGPRRRIPSSLVINRGPRIMRHRNAGRKFKRSPSHRRMLLRNLATSLLEHGRMETTLAKAKEIQPFVEKLITLAKDGWNLNNFRRVLAVLTKKDVAFRLFKEIGPMYKNRPGGYTRIYKLAKVRQGDAAPMAVISLLGGRRAGRRRRRDRPWSPPLAVRNRRPIRTGRPGSSARTRCDAAPGRAPARRRRTRRVAAHPPPPPVPIASSARSSGATCPRPRSSRPTTPSPSSTSIR